MRRPIYAMLALALALPAMSPADAQSVRSYRVEAHRDFWVNLNLCSARVHIEAQGDGDTDVDFTIYDASGRVAYQDLDYDDYTSVTLFPRARGGRGCIPHRLKLSNLGDVWNMVRVTVQDLR